VLDLAVVVREHPDLNRQQVAKSLVMKAKARSVPVSKSAFRNPEVAERASVDFQALKQTTRTMFIPFDEAFAAVLGLVDSLLIAET
jgi:hypothetical protein